jgi:cell wall-associated NlpC family hydrolase
MSKIRTTLAALTATTAVGTGMFAGAAQAQAVTNPCSGSGTSVACAMKYAKSIDSSAKFGANNTATHYLQATLRQLNYPASTNTAFTKNTLAWLYRYQYEHALSSTGTVNPATIAALRGGKGQQRSLASASPAFRAYIAKLLTSSTSVSTASAKAAKAVAYARAHLGAPYHYGSTGPSSFDCSGLTQAAWKAAGVSIPRTAAAQWSGLKKVSKSALKPGDIVVFYSASHVGIYIGNGEVIHAPHTGTVVQTAAMSSMPVLGFVSVA